ncbi:MAG: hypothetical protein ABEJ26_14385 [Halosimplex sp.]
MRDRGESEVVGFVLIFAMILTTITLLSATGYAGLDNARDFARTNNAERAMTTLAENADDVARRGIRSRTTELKLAGGTLAVGDPVEMTVSGERVANRSENFTATYALRPLVYELRSGTRLVYVDGAVIRQEERGAVMAREPDLLLSGDSAVIPVVRLSSSRPAGIGGSSTVLARFAHNGTATARAERGPHALTVNVTSPRSGAWQRYLSAFSATTCSRSDTTVSCTLVTDRVFVSVRDVEFSTEHRR